MTDADLIAKLNQEVPEFVLDWCELDTAPANWWEDDVGCSQHFDIDTNIIDTNWIYFGLIVDAMIGKGFSYDGSKSAMSTGVHFSKVNDEGNVCLGFATDINKVKAAGVAALKALEVWDA